MESNLKNKILIEQDDSIYIPTSSPTKKTNDRKNFVNLDGNAEKNFYSQKSNVEKESDDSGSKLSGLRKILNEAFSDFSPDEEKIKFNKEVEKMASYYSNQDEISTFKISQFLEILIIHFIYFILGPFSIFILCKKYKLNLLRNLGFYGKRLCRSHVLQIFYWVTFIITVSLTIVFSLSKDDDLSKQYVFLSPAYIGQIMIAIRYINVCIKYGFFPPEYYKRFKDDTEEKITRTELKYNFLLQGWIKPSLLVLDVYIHEIFQKYNIDFNTFRFQCIGTPSDILKDNLKQLDNEINEDAKKIRLSLDRRFNKSISYAVMLFLSKNKKKKKKNRIKRSRNSSIEENQYQESICEKNDIDIELSSTMRTSTTFLENTINCNNINETNRKKDTRQKFRNFVMKKLIPDIRENKRNDSLNHSNNIIKKKGDKLYEIKGIYLCRIILKDFMSVSLKVYSIYHNIIIFFISITPVILLFLYILKFNNGIEKNAEKKNGIEPLLQNKNLTIISIEYYSILLLLYSIICIIPPIWLNTKNLIYGIIDIKRKSNIYNALSEMINPNIKQANRIYPLLNVVNSGTMLNWYYLRKMFMQFGKRFSDRIFLQTSIFLLIIILSMSIVLCVYIFYSNPYIIICLGMSFLLSICSNLIIIFKMFLQGANFNFYEYYHNDLLINQQIFLEELKISLSIYKNLDWYEVILQKKELNSLNISNNCYGADYYNALLSNEYKNTKMIDVLNNTLNVILHIKRQIKYDHIIRPLRLFWIKADYNVIMKICTLFGTCFSMIMIYIFRNINFQDYFKTLI